jgi:hypothetical protein
MQSKLLTAVTVDSWVSRIGHDERKLSTDMPVGFGMFLGLCGVQIDGDLLSVVVTLREQ